MSAFMNDLLGDVDRIKLIRKPNRTKEINPIGSIEPQTGSLAFLLDDGVWMDYDAVVDHFVEVVDCRSASLYANALLELGELAQFEIGIYDVCHVKNSNEVKRVIWDHEQGFWVELK
ncbi:hypothetical protein [Aeromonas hydrophila]